ncbi:MAG: serine/threonine protein kinase, partial [Acidobacteria bacterium]|nr:serine/threonine protein kinase [Acidobacteriota bacterium]
MGEAPALESDRRLWERIEEVFHGAEELPAERRAAYLEEACGGDEVLRARVESLLAADDGKIGSVAQLLERSGTAGDLGSEEEPFPERIGSYRLLREVGRGGLASVFLAERDDGTFRKHVALKLVRRGLDTRDILDRFRQERQILARLDHPNIARLLDGGSTEDGRPYFVMEHVEGLPIDEFCRQRQLSLEERLELFRTVCAAVHFAHQNLTIHRDIKPSNILVTEDGAPKLLDFGIARVLESDGSQTTRQMTGPGLRLLTPAYASPEQIRGEALSTATDVYSLGLLLFRLLTGTSPYDLEGLPFHRLEKLICETPAPRPSQRLTVSALVAAGLGDVSLKRWQTRLTGDLDTIASMALRKEPE